jgi:hypothetical protein
VQSTFRAPLLLLLLFLLPLLFLGCPSGSKAPAATANSPAPLVVDDGEPHICFECDTEFTGAGANLGGLPGRHVCSKECKKSLQDKVAEARAAGEVICSACGASSSSTKARRSGAKRFCDAECADQWTAETPVPSCPHCDEALEDGGSPFMVTNGQGLSGNVNFCGKECADGWVETMNTQK